MLINIKDLWPKFDAWHDWACPSLARHFEITCYLHTEYTLRFCMPNPTPNAAARAATGLPSQAEHWNLTTGPKNKHYILTL